METQQKRKQAKFEEGQVFTPKTNSGIPVSPRANTLSSHSAVRSPSRKDSKTENLLIRRKSMILKNPQPIANVYKLEDKPMGSGAFGVVVKAEHKSTG